MKLDVEIFRDDLSGQLKVCVGGDNESGCHYDVASLEEAAKKIAEHITETFEDDGADIVYKVR